MIGTLSPHDAIQESLESGTTPVLPSNLTDYRELQRLADDEVSTEDGPEFRGSEDGIDWSVRMQFAPEPTEDRGA